MDASDVDLGCVLVKVQEPATKVKRTYGRRQENLTIGEDVVVVSASTSRFHAPIASGSSVLDDIRSTKSSLDSIGDNMSPTFGWRKKLAEIDEEFDNRDTEATVTSGRNLMGEERLRMSTSAQSFSTEEESSSRLDDSLLSGSLPPLTSSQTDDSSIPAFPKQKAKKNSFIDSDDSDIDRPVANKESSPTSPLFPHPINTPSQRSSPTPPSSDAGEENSLAYIRTGNRADNIECEAAVEHSHLKSSKKCRNNRTKLEEKGKKIKKLNKKEEKESVKQHARIMAEQPVGITKKSAQISVTDFLSKFKQTQRGLVPPKRTFNATSSDPIQDFTSSPPTRPDVNGTETQPKAGPSTSLDDSNDEMLERQDIFHAQREKKQKVEAAQHRKAELTLAKQQALRAQALRVGEGKLSESDNDDDLEVVEEAIIVDEKPKRSIQAQSYEKKLAHVAGFRIKSGRHSLPMVLEGSQGDKALKLAAKSDFSARQARRASGTMDQRALKTLVSQKAERQAHQLTKEKEEEWIRRGGRLPGKQRAALSNNALTIEQIADSLAQRKNVEADNRTDSDSKAGQDNSDEDDDGDWMPLERGSASPSGSQSLVEAEEEDSAGEDNENENVLIASNAIKADGGGPQGHESRRLHRHANRVVVSDSDEENAESRTKARILVPETSMVLDDAYIQQQVLAHRGSVSSMSETPPDEDNKENDTRLMFDHSEDKENLAVPRHQLSDGRRPLGRRYSSSIFDLEEQARRLSMSPAAESSDAEQHGGRKALQVRLPNGLDEPIALLPSVGLLNRDSLKVSSVSSKSESPKGQLSGFSGNAMGFSQFFDDDENVAPVVNKNPTQGVLQERSCTGNSSDVLADLQPSFEPKPMQLGGLSDLFSPEPGTRVMDGFKRPESDEELSLTFDTRLQPALEVSTQLRRKADAIFEKEQNFILEEATSTRLHVKPELYVTETGLLTQTKPDVSTPLVYRAWSPTQNSTILASQGTMPPSTQRIPLKTISLMSDSFSPTQPQRLSRLVKGKDRARPPSDNESMSVNAFASTSSRLGNAFDEMLRAARKDKKREAKKLAKSDFVEGEAQESDDDEMFGFGGPKKDDDEDSDDDDTDAVVEDLVDDIVMDAEQLAEDKVLEKVKEQLEEDDAALQKYHQSAIEGKYRSKRRGGGMAMDDSDSDEDEDDEARRLRRRMHKKRKVDGDTLEALAKDERSRAFYDAYQRDVQDDDNDDFAHLAKDEMDDDAAEGDENEEPETVTTSELQAQLREAARERKGNMKKDHVFDPEDTTWANPIDLSDDDEDLSLEVQEVVTETRNPARSRAAQGPLDVSELDSIQSSNWNEEQLLAWRREQSGKNFGTGGLRGAVTVTGLGAKNERRGQSTARTARHAAGVERTERRKVIPKSASILASVTDKLSRFNS